MMHRESKGAPLTTRGAEPTLPSVAAGQRSDDPQHDEPAQARSTQPTVGALSFYQALRRIESAHPERARIGEAGSPSQEPVRLGQDPSLAAHANSLSAMKWVDDAGVLRVRVNFFGAFGANGPLPLHLTEFAHQRVINHRDRTFVAFVDIFHHRLLSLFYRAWANAQPTVSYDRPSRDLFARYLRSLSGQRETRGSRSHVDDHALHMSGMFATQARHPEGLSKLISGFFDVPVRVEEYVGEWLTVPDTYRWRLGGSRVEGITLGKLGESARLGGEVWECQTKFRLVLGPLTRQQYDSFLPGSAQLAQLKELVQRYVGKESAWDLKLLLQHTDRQPTVLGVSGTLGLTSHIGSPELPDERTWQDLIFAPLHTDS
ncbi:MAG TPA: type VI secretion system baseplate subunit TssG [Polyangiales bacterium]